MLTRRQQEILRVLHSGRKPEYDSQLQELIDKKYVVERDGIYELSDAGLNKMRLVEGFGEAIADAFIPGAGANNSARN